MAKSKKTKLHKKIDGQLLQMNKSFNNLKMKQKDKITDWVYEEYKKYVTENEKLPDSEADEHIIDEVLDRHRYGYRREKLSVIITERSRICRNDWIMRKT